MAMVGAAIRRPWHGGEDDFLVYAHFAEGETTPYYIGSGWSSTARAWSATGRGPAWLARAGPELRFRPEIICRYDWRQTPNHGSQPWTEAQQIEHTEYVGRAIEAGLIGHHRTTVVNNLHRKRTIDSVTMHGRPMPAWATDPLRHWLARFPVSRWGYHLADREAR